MKHMLVTLNGTTVNVTLEGDPLERLWLRDYGETYTPPANILNGRHYNGQYGWFAGGFISLPPGTGIWIERVDQSPDLDVYEAVTFLPLWGTAGSGPLWRWSGVMVHNWYAADACGKYQASYLVYVGDAVTAVPTPGYSPGSITLYWQFVPEEHLGDLDGNLRVDLQDVARLQQCFTGPGYSTMEPDCGCADFDGDDDVDIDDSEVFFAELTGP